MATMIQVMMVRASPTVEGGPSRYVMKELLRAKRAKGLKQTGSLFHN